MENKIVDKLAKSIEYEFYLSYKDNFELLSHINDLQGEIEDLKEKVNYQDVWRKEYISRIDRTIDYIEDYWAKNSYYEDIENCMTFCEYDKNDLLRILKGE